MHQHPLLPSSAFENARHHPLLGLLGEGWGWWPGYFVQTPIWIHKDGLHFAATTAVYDAEPAEFGAMLVEVRGALARGMTGACRLEKMSGLWILHRV